MCRRRGAWNGRRLMSRIVRRRCGGMALGLYVGLSFFFFEEEECQSGVLYLRVSIFATELFVLVKVG
jgi:hypothetical protein